MPHAAFPALARTDGREVVRVGERGLTGEELRAHVARVGSRLVGRQRIALLAVPEIETCVGLLAGLAAGVTVVPISASGGSSELRHIVADSAPELLLAPRSSDVPPEIAHVPRFDVDLTDQSGGVTAERTEADEEIALVVYTSGTTGPPKGAMLSRRAILADLDALAEAWEWTADDRLTHALPLFHVHGLILGVLGPLRTGGAVELLPRFSVEAVAGAIERGATMVFGVPTMYHRIGEMLESEPSLAATFGRVRLLVSGSAGLPAVEHERIRRLTGQAIVERYGMTETLITISARASGPRLPGVVGTPLRAVDVRLVGESGDEVTEADDETIGEIEVRTPTLFAGYLNRPETTHDAFHDGWFRTGDLAVCTRDGAFRIVGRRSTDLIKSGGYRIGAGEIEAALTEHPAVAEAAVAGRPDDDLGERIVAWVVLREARSATADELAEHVGSLLARHKRPRDVHVVDSLPRNALGKVRKSELRP